MGSTHTKFTLNKNFLGIQLPGKKAKIFDLADIETPEEITLEDHCVMNKIHSKIELSGLPIVCHDYNSKNWQQKPSGAIKLTVFIQAPNSEKLKIGEFFLTNLGLFRYSQSLWASTNDSETSLDKLQAAQFDDLSIRLFNSFGKQTIKFESGLTAIRTLMAENFSEEKSLADNPMNQYLKLQNVPIQGFIWRIMQDLNNFRKFIFDKISILTHLSSFDLQSIVQMILKPGHQIDKDFLNQYGLRKRLIIVSEGEVIYSLDSLDGEILWSHYPNPGHNILRVLRGVEPGTLEYQYRTFKDDKEVTMAQLISAESGEKLGEPTLTYFKGDSKVLKLEGDQRIELDFEDHKIYSTANKKIFSFEVNDEGVSGYTIHSMKLNEVWNIKFSENEHLIEYSYHLKGFGEYFKTVDQGFFVQIPEENSLLYKIVDSHNLAVVTKLDSKTGPVLNVYIINGKRGKIMAKYQNHDVDFKKKINLVYDDNGIFVSYFNKKVSNTEIWVIEIMKNEIESDFLEV